MLLVLLGVYAFVGSVSAFTNLGQWVFKSNVWAIPFLPFSATYFAINGDEKRKKEALFLLKAISVFVALWLIISVIISLCLQKPIFP